MVTRAIPGSEQAGPFRDPRQRLRATARCLPERPGIYMMRDAWNKTIYVGKAVNLRRRVGSYSTPSAMRDRKVSKLVAQVDSLAYVETSSELEALLIESRLIKEVHPAFNRQLVEPESCCYLRYDPDEPLPRVEVVVRANGDALYLGPFWNSPSVREAAEGVTNVLRLRRCSGSLRPGGRKWPCVFHELGKCSGPCSGRVTLDDYRRSVQAAWDSLRGTSSEAARLLAQRRDRLSDDLKFEEAHAVHRRIRALEEVAVCGASILSLAGDFAVVAPSYLRGRPVILLFADGKLRDELLAGPTYPDPGILGDRLTRLASPGEDLFPGRPSIDDLLIIHSYLRRHGLAKLLVPLTPGEPAPALALHASICALRKGSMSKPERQEVGE